MRGYPQRDTSRPYLQPSQQSTTTTQSPIPQQQHIQVLNIPGQVFQLAGGIIREVTAAIRPNYPPTYSDISFSCVGRVPGYYADISTKCKVKLFKNPTHISALKIYPG